MCLLNKRIQSKVTDSIANVHKHLSGVYLYYFLFFFCHLLKEINTKIAYLNYRQIKKTKQTKKSRCNEHKIDQNVIAHKKNKNEFWH